ncbi:WLM-domain-containing protein [Mycena sanguinolenta]|uniref:WLM-domain-containing protein n=1 Tax=Mycena sanguinolenta TaxID=230812 RepID=A0A8H7DKT0_9AGAR|nr:WLM-domain-containing protein [Mycena sanguinolenta]
MVHVRFNERETNPNPYVNFISALDTGDPASQEDARQFLRALAAQVKPLMKAHGLVVNSLEEYEFNRVFAGRNWNAGETSWCYVDQMDRGYYGDGMWSSGHRLMDSAEVLGDGIEAGEFPEFLCGGAQQKSRPSALGRKRRVRRRREIVASNKTGRQTAKKRKAGSRVKSQSAFSGEGSLLKDGALDPKGKGVGFRKQAGSKRAREERALAAEQRIKALQAAERRMKPQADSTEASTSKADEPGSGEENTRIDDSRRGAKIVLCIDFSTHSFYKRPHPKAPWETISEPESDEVDDLDEDEFEDEPVGETDAERRQALLSSGTSEDLVPLKAKDWKDFEKDFNFTRGDAKNEPIEILSDDDDIPIASGSTFVMSGKPPKGE